MKRNIFLIALIAWLATGATLGAQDLKTIKPVFEACKNLREAIRNGTPESLRAANKTLKSMKTQHFGSLRPSGGNSISLNGHFLFDSEFIDSLLVNRKTYTYAQRYADRSKQRGTGKKGYIYMSTVGIKKNSTMKYTFTANGNQELGIVTEPGGAISIKVYDKSNKKMLFRDTKDINKGQPSRSCTFTLPQGKRCLIELEISNRSNKDISLAVVGN